VAHLCRISEKEGVECVVDGDEDNGIDAIYLSKDTVYLVQAKYKRGEPDRDEDISPFLQGVRELLEGEYKNFKNPLFLAIKDEVEEAIADPDIKTCLIFTHMGRAIENHALTAMQDFCLDTGSEHRDINGQLIHAALLSDESPKGVKRSFILEHHRYTETAPRVAFGLITVQQLAELFHEYGTLIFDQNIRSFLGRNTLSREIEASLRSNPSLFAHYNNGITMICKRLSVPTTKNRVQAQYKVQGLSIVNGAQTVGSIAQAIPRGDPNPPHAHVMLTIIETEGAGDTFAVDVTRTRNTQNPIPREAFAAQDMVNEHLRQKLAMYDVKYVYKPGQDERDADFTLRDLANALAMFSDEPTDALTRDVAELLNIRSDAYKRLFKTALESTAPERVYRIVQFAKQVEETLSDYQRQAAPYSRERKFYGMMRPLIRYWVAQCSRVVQNGNTLLLTKSEKSTLSRDAQTHTQQVIEATFKFSVEQNKGIQAISNSPADCRTILSNLEQQRKLEQRQVHEQRVQAQASEQ